MNSRPFQSSSVHHFARQRDKEKLSRERWIGWTQSPVATIKHNINQSRSGEQRRLISLESRV